jgi:pimeloyl-ACP methyl ester carboxylesterase
MIERAVPSFDGTEIWFDSQGDGPVVVLLHGATMTSISNFDTYFAAGVDGRVGPATDPTISSLLRDAGAPVVGVDTRGHGRFGWSTDPERYRGDVHARDVAHVLDALGAERLISSVTRWARSLRLSCSEPRAVCDRQRSAEPRFLTIGSRT